MGAFHVIGVDFQLGLQIGRRGALQQQRLHRLHRIGLLRIARDRNLAEIGSRRPVIEHDADRLAAAGIRRDVADGCDNLQHRVAAADLHCTKLEMGAVVQRHVNGNPAVAGPSVDDLEVQPRTGRQRHLIIMDAALVGQQDPGVGRTGANLNHRRWPNRPQLGHRRMVAVPPRLNTPGGEHSHPRCAFRCLIKSRMLTRSVDDIQAP